MKGEEIGLGDFAGFSGCTCYTPCNFTSVATELWHPREAAEEPTKDEGVIEM